ncbi:nuclease [Peteryoungia ipomoeae]|uniref:Nuclease n=1 Tax=Peteryoungia ipomoeae TaxID=1210932 RepID=A0A4S8P570_9HYPH|nr:nuclease [Peteryoungia ipomoeae]THV25307.1 nuclease [Peteryoungia ipomoeae]
MSSAASSRRAPNKRRKSSRSSARASGQGMTSWLVLLGLVAGGIGLYENRDAVLRTLKPYGFEQRRETRDQASETAQSTRKRDTQPKETGVARAPVPPKPVPGTSAALAAPKPKATAESSAGTALAGASGPFYFCGTSGLDMCVTSGDSFWYKKKRYVLADVVAPRIDDAGCAQERQVGFASKVRLRALLNAGRFDLEPLGGAAAAGSSALRVATRNGRSLGSMLVSEGLAKPRAVKADIWCR